MNLVMLDVVFIILLAFFSIRGIITGFVQEFFSKAAVVVGLIIAFFFYQRLAVTVKEAGLSVVPEIISFLILFLITYLCIKLLQKVAEKLITGQVLPGLDKALGFFLGIIESILVISLILLIICRQPFFDLSSWTRNSKAFELLAPLIENKVAQFSGSMGV